MANTPAMVIKSKNKYYVQSIDRMSIIEIPELSLVYASKYGTDSFENLTSLISNIQIVMDPGLSSEYLQSTTVPPFCLYDFFEQEIEVFYLTEEQINPISLSVECDWSPLDELGDNYEVVLWTDETNAIERLLTLDAIPLPQTLSAHKPFYFEELEKVTVNYTEAGCGKVFLHLSADKGVTWAKYRAGAINALSATELKTLFNNKELMYKVELERDHNEDVATFSGITINDKDYYMSINFKDFLLTLESVVEKIPRIYVSYDNEVTWIELTQNEINDLGQEEIEKMTLKVVLENGQQLYAIAYSWI